MVFSSINPPLLYLDPPNWQQQQQQHQQQQIPPHQQTHHDNNLPPPQLMGGSTSGGGSGNAASVRPGSMTDRARLAKLPQPELASKCPRCDSTNTKFCYFNNYSLSQPRHFCKTCRRYWTRGGALRNVPVGGGCRRNKRSNKGSSNNNNNNNKNNSSSSMAKPTTSSSSSIQISNSSNTTTDLTNCHLNTTQLSNQLPNFMASLHHFSSDYGGSDNLGLSYNQNPITGTTAVEHFQMGSSTSTSTDHQQWRFQQMQQFPFMGSSFEAPLGLYPFQVAADSPVSNTKQQQQASGSSNSSLVSQFASVKMEESHQQQGMNLLSRQFLSNVDQQRGSGSHQYWSNNGNAWTDLSGFNSSSTSSHLL